MGAGCRAPAWGFPVEEFVVGLLGRPTAPEKAWRSLSSVRDSAPYWARLVRLESTTPTNVSVLCCRGQPEHERSSARADSTRPDYVVFLRHIPAGLGVAVARGTC